MKKVSSKKQWLDTTENQGAITIDEGACKALNQNNSLLFVGIKNVINSFEKGDVINWSKNVLEPMNKHIGFPACPFAAKWRRDNKSM